MEQNSWDKHGKQAQGVPTLVFFSRDRHTIDQQLVQPVPFRVQRNAHYNHHQMHRKCAVAAFRCGKVKILQ